MKNMKPVVVARNGGANADDTARTAVWSALREVNGDASAHTITTHEEVLAVCREVERMFQRAGLPKGGRGPCHVTHRPAGPAAASYGYSAITTRISLERTKGGVWRLVGAERVRVNPKVSRVLRVEIAAEMSVEIARRALEPFSVPSPSMVLVRNSQTGRYERWFHSAVPLAGNDRTAMHRWCRESMPEGQGYWLDQHGATVHGWFERENDAAVFRLQYDTGG